MEKGKIHKVSTKKQFRQSDKPEILYKYQPVTEYSIANLKNGKLWASLPESFNDPFEYKHKIVGEPGRTEWDDLYKRKNGISIICLTEVPNNILMWSHYADSHCGFCIGFQITTLTTKVRYTNDYPTLDFTKVKDAQILAWHTILHTKSTHWEYEKEHRMVFADTASLREYPGKLVSMVFGSKMKEEDKKQIKEILKDSVVYYQAELSQNSYKINIIKSKQRKS